MDTRKLEWEQMTPTTHIARTSFGLASIMMRSDSKTGCYMRPVAGDTTSACSSLEEAMDEAQKDFDNRILQCLEHRFYESKRDE